MARVGVSNHGRCGLCMRSDVAFTRCARIVRVMTTMFVFDEDYSADGINRRLDEEFARRGIKTETEAAKRYGRPQQWVSRHLTGATAWKLTDLRDFCDKLGLDYPYVILGIRQQPKPPTDGEQAKAGGQIIRFPAPPKPVPLPRDTDTVDEDALRYVAIAEGDSSLLPRLDSSQQPFGCRPADARPARLRLAPVIDDAEQGVAAA